MYNRENAHIYLGMVHFLLDLNEIGLRYKHLQRRHNGTQR